MTIKKTAKGAPKFAKSAKLYGSIEKAEKQDDGTMIVMGFASSESVDSDGEIIKADAMKAAIPAYMKFANVRVMHKSDTAVGTVLEMETQDDGRTWVKTHIVDAEACKKVEHKVFKGFSIGGRVTERDADDKHIIKGITLSEISLVDRPANPEAVFTFAKAEGAQLTEEEQATLAAGDDLIEDANADEDAANDNAGEGEEANDNVADSDESATEDKEAAEKSELQKGMYAIGCFARILGDINCLQESSQWEADYEKDGSTLPAGLKEWLKTGGALLSAMVTEEVAELTATDEVTVEVIELGARATTLLKAAWSKEDAEAFEKAWGNLTSPNTRLAKVGAKHSKATIERVGKMHDLAQAIVTHAKALGHKVVNDDSDKEAAASTDDLQKAVKESSAIAKMLEAVDGESNIAKVEQLVEISEAMAKRVKALEALPAAPKAIIKAVEKNTDTSKESSETAGDEVIKTDTIEGQKAALKKSWAAGGKPL